MIRILYDGKTRMEITGHAGSAPKGQNLICAAVTALALTLGENGEKVRISPGHGVISGGDPVVYRAMARGFQLLAHSFPQEIHYKCTFG